MTGHLSLSPWTRMTARRTRRPAAVSEERGADDCWSWRRGWSLLPPGCGRCCGPASDSATSSSSPLSGLRRCSCRELSFSGGSAAAAAWQRTWGWERPPGSRSCSSSGRSPSSRSCRDCSGSCRYSWWSCSSQCRGCAATGGCQPANRSRCSGPGPWRLWRLRWSGRGPSGAGRSTHSLRPTMCTFSTGSTTWPTQPSSNGRWRPSSPRWRASRCAITGSPTPFAPPSTWRQESLLPR